MVAEFLIGLVAVFGYLGLFAASLLGSAIVIFPIPIFVIIFTAGAVLNPFLVGIIAGIGSAIGELVSYGLGFGGRKILGKRIKVKERKWLSRGKKWLQSYGAFFLVFIFAATPLPDDIIGLICGAMRYDIKRFFIACLLGKVLLSLMLAYAGYYGLGWILSYLGR
jgi:membrane protein YqaA with SNARE-associated domain